MLKINDFTQNIAIMKLYSVPGSPPSLIVRLTLAALDIPFELKNVDFESAEHLSEDYAKVYSKIYAFFYCFFFFNILNIIIDESSKRDTRSGR